jgi:hypothetical protein
MATTTPNYGWAVPTSTDLVKDGATAIETLGDAIDASMNTALGTKKAGMVLLNTTSFSAVSSFNLNANTFSATYENYQIVLRLIASTVNGLRVRMRAAGTSDTGSNYRYANFFIDGNAATGSEGNSNSNTLAVVGGAVSTSGFPSNFRLEIYSPFLAEKTTATLQSTHFNASGQLNSTVFGGFIHNLATSYDSIEFVASTGTFTGNYSVYGYNK